MRAETDALLRLLLVAALASLAPRTSSAQATAAPERVALLPTSFGDSEPSAPAALAEALAASPDLILSSPAQARERIALRGVQRAARPLDEAALAAAVEEGERLYFEAAHAAALARLESEPLLGALGEVLALAEQPDAGASFRRGALAAARALVDLGEGARAEAWMDHVIRHFPTWTPSTEWYPPSFVARYLERRDALLSAGGEVVVSGPEASCRLALNGLLAGEETPVALQLPAGRYAVALDCPEAGRGGAHVVEIPPDSASSHALRLDPRLDAALDASAGEGAPRLRLRSEEADAPELLARLGGAYAELVEVDRVILVGPAPDAGEGALQWVEVRRGASQPARMVRLPAPAGTAPTAAWVEQARGERTCLECSTWSDGAWQDPPGPTPLAEEPASAWPWWLAGAAGASLVSAAVLGAVEADRYDEFDACGRDPACAGSARERELQRSGQRLGTAASVTLAVGAAALVGALVGWLIQGADDAETGLGAGEGRLGWSLAPTFSAGEGGLRIGLDL